MRRTLLAALVLVASAAAGEDAQRARKPATHTVTTASDAGLSVRHVTLSEHQLLGSKP